MLFDKNQASLGKMQYHLRLRSPDVAQYVLLPGDPDRVLRIAKHLDDPREVAHNREYRTVTGSYRGTPVTGTSTGIGCPSAAIAVEELSNIGATHFVRVGSSAALRPGISTGDIIINTGTMRLDGTSAAYVDDGFPAIPNYLLVQALIEAASRLSDDRGFGVHVGVNASSDAFYAETPEFIENLRRHNVMNIEMESSAIFTIAHLRDLKAAMVCAVSYNYNDPDDIDYEQENVRLAQGWENAIDVALEGIHTYQASAKL